MQWPPLECLRGSIRSREGGPRSSLFANPTLERAIVRSILARPRSKVARFASHTEIGHSRPSFGPARPKLAKFGPICCLMLHEIRPGLVEPVPCMVELGPSSVPNSVSLGQIGACSVQFRPNSVRSWSNTGQIRSMSVEVWSSLFNILPKSARFGRTRPEFG